MSEKISRRNFLRTATLGAAAAGLLAGCGNSAASGSTAASTAAGTYTAGTYSATATGINTTTPVTVTMTFSADAITDVQIDVANETKGYGADIADEMVKKILDANPKAVGELKEGKDKVIGFLMGQVMKEMKGKANPSQVSGMIHKLVQE